jgi:excisionase family DNA binding protein
MFSPATVLERLERLEDHLKMIERKLDLLSGPPPAYAYTLREAAQMLSMSESKLRGLLRERKLSTVRLGGRQYVPVSELIRVTTPPLTRLPRRPVGPRPRSLDGPGEAEKIRALAKRKD